MRVQCVSFVIFFLVCLRLSIFQELLYGKNEHDDNGTIVGRK
jgi:hypothetical protein